MIFLKVILECFSCFSSIYTFNILSCDMKNHSWHTENDKKNYLFMFALVIDGDDCFNQHEIFS